MLDEALAVMAADPRVKPHLLDTPEIFGWNSLGDWSVTVRQRVKVSAGKQGEVARVMRQYALEALREAGVPVESHNRITLQSTRAEAVEGVRP